MVQLIKRDNKESVNLATSLFRWKRLSCCVGWYTRRGEGGEQTQVRNRITRMQISHLNAISEKLIKGYWLEARLNFNVIVPIKL